MLKNSFNNLPPADQHRLVEKTTIIVFIGAALILCGILYPFLPREFRIISMLLLLPTAFFEGKRTGRRIMMLKYIEPDAQKRLLLNMTRRIILASAVLVIAVLYPHWSIETRMLAIPFILLAAWESAQLVTWLLTHRTEV